MFIVLVALVISMSCMSTMNVSAAQKVKLNKKKVTIYVGKTTTLKLKNNKKKIKWSTSNKKVATVSKKGKVKGKKAGKATITAKVGKKKYKCKVTVKKMKKSSVYKPQVSSNSKPQTVTAKYKIIDACKKYGTFHSNTNEKYYYLSRSTVSDDQYWMEYYTSINYYPDTDTLKINVYVENTSTGLDYMTIFEIKNIEDDTCKVKYIDSYDYSAEGVVYKKLIHLDEAVDFYSSNLMESIDNARYYATSDIRVGLLDFDYIMGKYSVGVSAKDLGFTTLYSRYQ